MKYELKDTVNLMLSDDWRARLKGEYLQAKIRLEKLNNVIENKVGNIDENHFHGLQALLEKQRIDMESYVSILEERIEFHALTNYVNQPLNEDGL